jgi:hypothetical protein
MVVTEAGIEFTVHVKHTEIKVRVLINIIVQGWNSQNILQTFNSHYWDRKSSYKVLSIINVRIEIQIGVQVNKLELDLNV